jgi:hypothetical protein
MWSVNRSTSQAFRSWPTPFSGLQLDQVVPGGDELEYGQLYVAAVLRTWVVDRLGFQRREELE